MGRDLSDHDKTYNHTDNKTNAKPQVLLPKEKETSFAAPSRLSGDFGLAIQGTIDLNKSNELKKCTDPPGFEPGSEAPEASILSRLYYESIMSKIIEYIG